MAETEQFPPQKHPPDSRRAPSNWILQLHHYIDLALRSSVAGDQIAVESYLILAELSRNEICILPSEDPEMVLQNHQDIHPGFTEN